MTNILGVRISNKTQEETVEYLNDLLNVPQTALLAHIITANPEIVMNIRKSKGYQRVARQADLITPDGIGIVIASKLLGGDIKERVTGLDTITALFEKREKDREVLRVYCLGADEETIKKAVWNLENTYQYVKIVGFHNGYFPFDKEDRIIKEINRCKADLLLVGMGSPRQDQFIYNNKKRLRVKVAIGVGGTFDVWGEKTKRAPMCMRNMGLEWLWRLLLNPMRIFRQMKLLSFLIHVLKQKFSKN